MMNPDLVTIFNNLKDEVTKKVGKKSFLSNYDNDDSVVPRKFNTRGGEDYILSAGWFIPRNNGFRLTETKGVLITFEAWSHDQRNGISQITIQGTNMKDQQFRSFVEMIGLL